MPGWWRKAAVTPGPEGEHHQADDPTPPGTPFGVVLAQRRKDAAAARGLLPQQDAHKPHPRGSAGSTVTANKSESKLSAGQIMRKYKAKVKPKTTLYLVFLAVSVWVHHVCG
jgi:hypothetical protein